MKTICFISDRNIYMKRIANYLTDLGYKVHIICRHQNGLSVDNFHPKIVFHQLSSVNLKTKWKEMGKIFRETNPDIVHLHYLTKDAILPIFFHNKRFKYIISVWGSDINLFSTNYLNKFFQNISLLFCDTIHTFSPYLESLILRKFVFINKKKLKNITIGIDKKFLTRSSMDSRRFIIKKYNLAENTLLILSFRQHKPVYNHHTTIKAICDVICKYPEARFIFTRGNFDEEYLKESLNLVKEKKVERYSIFIDKWLSDEELAILINAAHVNINIPLMDGLPASLLEIMATKSIPIISNLKNYHSFFRDGENGFYLNNLTDEKTLADLIIKSLDNYDMYSALFTRNNNRYIEQYQNWSHQSKLWLDLYNQ